VSSAQVIVLITRQAFELKIYEYQGCVAHNAKY